MVAAPSIKEALEYIEMADNRLECDCKKCVDVARSYLVEAKEALATFQPDGERREAITIERDDSGVFFATSSDAHSLFCAATSLREILAAIGRALGHNAHVQEKSPGALDAPHNTGERELVVMPTYAPGGTESRVKARLAWNNWPDTEDSRRTIADHEAKDKNSADAWDRVISSLASGLVQNESGWRTMDSAPKDGTRIIYHNGDRMDPVIGYCIWSRWPEEDNFEAWWDYERDTEAFPKFWMSELALPAPPIRSAREGGYS